VIDRTNEIFCTNRGKGDDINAYKRTMAAIYGEKYDRTPVA